jgi:Na+-translocating ferredoxin:NAD+ oxidoreductase RNF subunit RnfB
MNTRIVLSARFNLRVEDFQDCHILAVECMHCGHKGCVSASTLRKMFRPYERIKLIEGKLRCGQCGHTGSHHWYTAMVGTND